MDNYIDKILSLDMNRAEKRLAATHLFNVNPEVKKLSKSTTI